MFILYEPAIPFLRMYSKEITDVPKDLAIWVLVIISKLFIHLVNRHGWLDKL